MVKFSLVFFKGYLELYTMDLSVTIDEHFIKYNYCLVLCLIFNHFLKTKYTESNGKHTSVVYGFDTHIKINGHASKYLRHK